MSVNGSPGRTRTSDTVVNSHLLYRLSYRGMPRVGNGRAWNFDDLAVSCQVYLIFQTVLRQFLLLSGGFGAISARMSDMAEQLTELLQQAADGQTGAVEVFFLKLLEGKVFVPLSPGGGYAMVEYQGTSTLPIFTEERFVAEWAEAETQTSEEDFKRILHRLPEDAWLYLNPAQEIGKELTPWEVEQLKRGPEAIPDLAAALREDVEEEFIVESGAELFPELQTKLLPILQIYPELEEAFLISLKEGETADAKPALGVKYGKINEAKRVYLRAEIENASAEHLPGHQQLFFIDDLGDENSPNWRLFAESKPFYFLPKAAVQTPPSGGLLRRLKGMFGRDKG